MKEFTVNRWIKVLDLLNRKGTLILTQISQETHTMDAHTYTIINLCKKKGIVTAEKKDRCVYVTLTIKGKALADSCSILLSNMRLK